MFFLSAYRKFHNFSVCEIPCRKTIFIPAPACPALKTPEAFIRGALFRTVNLLLLFIKLKNVSNLITTSVLSAFI